MAQSPLTELTEPCVHDEVTYNGKCLAINRDYKTRGRKLLSGRRGIRDPEVLLFLRASAHPGQCQNLELVLVLEAPTWVFSLLPTRNPEAEIV